MVRITTGISKNKHLKTPNTKEYRAVQEVAKGSLFSMLGEKVVNAVCLDLFAGSGNLGFEALSRGAQWCDFVDISHEAGNAILRNIEELGYQDKAEFFHRDAIKYVANTEKSYDIIFLDPFYNTTSHRFLMQNIEEILNNDGITVFFHGNELSNRKTCRKFRSWDSRSAQIW